MSLAEIWSRLKSRNPTIKHTASKHLAFLPATMVSDSRTQRFFSLEFHTSFFPRILRDRCDRKKRSCQGAIFTSTMEMLIGLAVCLILAIIGIPYAWTEGSIVGWLLSIIGMGGIIVLIMLSISSSWGEHPTYDDFLAGVFFFFICLGLFIGIPIGMDRHSLLLGILASLAGLVSGYLLGVIAGLQLQRLGWLAVVINMLAAFAAIILIGTMLVLLLVLVF